MSTDNVIALLVGMAIGMGILGTLFIWVMSADEDEWDDEWEDE